MIGVIGRLRAPLLFRIRRYRKRVWQPGAERKKGRMVQTVIGGECYVTKAGSRPPDRPAAAVSHLSGPDFGMGLNRRNFLPKAV